MVFPLDYRGEISCDSILISNVESFQHELKKKVRERLERAKASIVVRGDEISFTSNVRPTALLQMDSALLTGVPKGKMILNSDKGTITYYLDFRRGLIFLSLAVWGIFGSVFIFGTSGSLALKFIVIGFVWLFMVIVSGLTGIHRFKEFVNRILKEMNVKEL